MKLKQKLALALIVAGAIPLLIFIVVSLQNAKASAIETALSANQQKAEIVQGKIEYFVDKNLYGVKVLATNPEIKSLSPGTIKPILVDASKVYPDMSPLVVTNAQAMQLVKSDTAAMANVADRNFYKEAISGKAEVVSEVLVSKDNGHLIAVLAAPIKDDGKIKGVMQGSIELAVLNDFVKKLSDQSTTVYVLDRDGKLLAHPTKDLQKPEDRIDMGTVDFVKAAIQGESGSKLLEINNEKKLISYMRNDKTGWIICAEIPYHAAIAASEKAAIQLGVIGLLILLLVGIAAYWLAGIAIRPILAYVQAADSISSGNLKISSFTANTSDELGILGTAFNRMVKNLHHLIQQVQENSVSLASASEQLNASASQSAEAANQVAVSITHVAENSIDQRNATQTAAGIAKEMSMHIGRAADSARRVAKESQQSVETAQNGGTTIQSAVQEMTELEETVEKSSKVVGKLGERSQEIGQITSAISDIASQTNLLALNAAIEAARAGEHGKGFAVVAEEVRKLAEQSHGAAKQIEDLIHEIQLETNQAVTAMALGSKKTQTATEVVQAAGNSFSEIINRITSLSSQVKNITNAVEELEGGSHKIVSAVEEISLLTQTASDEAQNVSAATEEQSASMQEISSSSMALAQMAHDLEEETRKFKI